MEEGIKRKLICQKRSIENGVTYLSLEYVLSAPYDDEGRCFKVKWSFSENGNRDEEILRADSMEQAIEKIRAYYKGLYLEIISAELLADNTIPKSSKVMSRKVLAKSS